MFDPDKQKKTLAEINAQLEEPGLWGDSSAAKKLLQTRAQITELLQHFADFQSRFADAEAWEELAKEDPDSQAQEEAETAFAELWKQVRMFQLENMLSGEADGANCYLELHAGAGGVEAQDWAQMLMRMYMRWAAARKFSVEYLHESPGEEAGIKSASIKISGSLAYGWLKTEVGVHRLVRISPYDSGARRHTSFASVWVYPEVTEEIVIEIEDKELRVDTYRASGAGGQHINKTDSAVRLTHLPSGIVVQCQNHRSQHRNRANAMEMLRSRLYEKTLREQEEKAQASAESKGDIAWGHQIRSYVLQPYRLVKDLRTGVEKPDPERVLQGDIDDFLEASLAAKKPDTQPKPQAKSQDKPKSQDKSKPQG